MIASGKPYVSINADHSDPGRILKYAPKPYLFVHKHMDYEQICIKKKKNQNMLHKVRNFNAIQVPNRGQRTHDKSESPPPRPITPNETCIHHTTIN